MISDRIELFIDIFLENDNPLVQVFGWTISFFGGGIIWMCALASLVWDGIREKVWKG